MGPARRGTQDGGEDVKIQSKRVVMSSLKSGTIKN